ncbi:transcriptional regulator [Amycolatopsis sp. AA4]|uniref:winged helix-turn-helix transcriptional regulator n=1 Tax=Actinomycetes TaxID=1760 RepID=UPI0001B58030|nr:MULTISPECIES: helix-turn-helix domain-containing protein [Actinomycetes]ATY11383.1 transcriptional regulator [Amycolatopsis sp. AA4]EFL07001.1 transcriptional regulator [Streptomyces sp. AA4]
MGVSIEAGRRAAPDPGDAFNSDCPGRTVLDHVCSRWGTLILLSLRERPARFYELRDAIGGISEKMLSQNLRTLTRDGLIHREVEPATPPKVTYSLTDLGQELTTPLRGLLDWVLVRTVDVVKAQRRHDRQHKAGA